MLFEYFFIGLVLGFLFYELTDVSPGGVIAPAYCALFVDQPAKLGMTVLVAALVWLLLEFASRYLLLYGRRKLLLAVLLGFCIKLAIEYQIQPLLATTISLQSIGYIIPGLIANESSRQGLLSTVAALGIVTVMTFLVILLMRAF
jgi:poly-gamma-glutamate biosynthesis protein PgsC/CapC